LVMNTAREVERGRERETVKWRHDDSKVSKPAEMWVDGMKG